MADDDSVDSDEWGAEELVIPADGGKSDVDNTNNENDIGNDYWEVKKSIQGDLEPKESSKESTKESAKDGEPMIIVDITNMNPDIHSKFDRNSVNQPEEASKLRKKMEKNYNDYAFSNDLLSEGTIIPCGSSVWRDALVRLRDDRPGHYFVPIFSPTKAK